MKKRDFRQVVLVAQLVRAKDLKSFFSLFQWEEQGALPLKSFSGSNPHLSVFFFGMPLREQGAPRGERENEVGFGDVGICTYLYLFSDQSASFFDSTRCSFSICFQ